MKKVLIIATVFILMATPAIAYCPLLYEYTSGFHKICVYDCIDGHVAITIDALELCPLSI